MKLVDLLSALDPVQVLEAPDVTVTGIAADSRAVRPGDLFVCIPGAHVDAHQFIPDALRRGAVAVVTQRPWAVPAGIGAAVVPDARLALSALADRFYGHPSRALRMVGVTGTNGKTTTAFLVEAIARTAGKAMGVIGTAGMMLGREVLEGKSGYTTPEPQTIHRLLAAMLQRGAWGAVMEVSSHALEQRRTDHCRFDVAVFTNLTHEHLDYHGDMEGYYAAKARLFRGLQPGAAAVVNIDDPYGRRLAEEIPAGVRTLTYGFSEGRTSGPRTCTSPARAPATGSSRRWARPTWRPRTSSAPTMCPTPWPRWGPVWPWASRCRTPVAALRQPRARRAGSSASMRGRTSRWWWTTPTRRTASRSCSPTWPGSRSRAPG
ncbi:MAG: hypothetical protein A6D92_00840 [Symbiobacterium thermophilum]|uniref:Mur ligase central domain-containing protein n=1 Tax=Symbiobacterium thermophilum TaxID=2734 RepID=A0A1Y2TAE4_SYMTR|nr:MAG: hypothetical protein A6D92_00840 [Symbiobacterium thermophilum]